ncbi:MAG: hypothetical protein K0S99_3296, partial [Thermomicrobiales bacterium]|nr:hypothetical protein [Thermomicrobiales bacterium]
MKRVVVVALTCSCLVLPASAQQVVKQLLPHRPGVTSLKRGSPPSRSSQALSA